MKRVMIVSGPTREAIDPVRYISNHSSGLTGYHLAQTARAMNFEPLIFVSGPVQTLPSEVGEIIPVESALEMRSAVMARLEQVDVVIMAAAVSDYRPRERQDHKIKKGQDELVLHLVKNPDILAEIGASRREGQIVVGFAAETDRGPQHAEEKLRRKNCDMIVLNEISEHNPAFGDRPNQVSFVTREGIEVLPSLVKEELAVRIWQRIAALVCRKGKGN